MKPVSELINQTPKDFGITQKSESKTLPEKVTVRIFAKLALKYAQRFTSVYPDPDVQAEAEREWGEALAGYSLDDIKRALDKCIDVHPSWPPTIGS